MMSNPEYLKQVGPDGFMFMKVGDAQIMIGHDLEGIKDGKVVYTPVAA